MKKTIAATLILFSMSAQAVVLEKIEEIPNPNGYLTWKNYSSAKKMREVYNVTYNGNPYKIASDTKKRLAEEKQKVCEDLDPIASITCLHAIEVEKTSKSAVAPVKMYLTAAMQSKAERREKALVLASKIAFGRLNEDAFVELLVDICTTEISCE